MRRLLHFLSGYQKECILAPLFKCLEACFDLLVPLVTADIIDTGIANQDVGYVMTMCVVLIVLALVGLSCSIVAQYFAARAAVGFSGRLRQALFARIQGLSYTQLDQQGAPTLITRMTSDINQVQNGVNMFLRLFMRSPFVVFGAMILAFFIDWKTALIFAGVIPLLGAVVLGILYLTMPRYKKVQGGLDQVLSIVRENLTGVRVIRAFNKEPDQQARFNGENRRLTKLQIAVGRIAGLMNPLTYGLINLAIVVLLYVGGIQIDAGALTQGQIIALVNYMNQILVELVKLANLIVTISKALACANRVADMLEVPQDMEQPQHPVTPESLGTVEFQNVGLTYQGAGGASLSGLSFSVQKGQTVGIIGGTGSGKTSLISLIPRFYDATQGRVLVDGVDVREQSAAQLRQRIGIVPQKAVLFTGTIRENLEWGAPHAREDLLWEALKLAQAEDVVKNKPLGLEEKVEQGGQNLSGGQRQRLTIARALVKQPEILILDDSASALDYATDAALRTAIRGMKNPPTTFIVSQRASSVRHADLILVLEEGHVAGMGTHEQLLEGCPVYQEIYWSQFEKEGSGHGQQK